MNTVQIRTFVEIDLERAIKRETNKKNIQRNKQRIKNYGLTNTLFIYISEDISPKSFIVKCTIALFHAMIIT